MNAIDWFVIAFYMAGMIALSAWVGRRTRTDRDYYVGGHHLPWYAIGLSTMATQCSTNSLLGAPAFVVLTGLVWLQYELAVPLAMLFLMWVLLPMYRRHGVISIYEYLEHRFGVETRTALSIIFQFTRAFSTGVTVYGISLVLEVATGIPFWQAVLLLGLVTVIYDVLGGMKAVVWSDVIQMIILVFGILVTGWALLGKVGGVSGVLEYAPDHVFRTLNFRGHGLGDGQTFAFWPMLIGGFFLYIAYYGCDQSQVQRELSGESIKAMRWSLFLNGMARFPLVLLYCVLGVALAAYLQVHPEFWQHIPVDNGTPRADALLPVFVIRYLPHGIIGLIVVALFAAAMSSLDSTINSLSATSSRDIVERFVLSPETEMPVWGNKALTLFWGIVCTAFAFVVGGVAPTVIEAVNKISSLMNGPLLATFLLAIFTVRTRNLPMLAGLISGFLVNVLFWLFLPSISWLWWNVIGTVVSLSVGYGASVLIPGPVYEDLVGRTYRWGESVRDPGDVTHWGRYYWTLALYAMAIVAALWLIQVMAL
jgi:SSS family solute:Na+ symporter